MKISIHKYVAFIVICCALVLTTAAAAQEFPKAEVFGGYQYTRIGGEVSANGWNWAVTGNVNRWFGVTADFSGNYKSLGGGNASVYTYTFGPTFSARGERITPFAHALFGGFRASAGIQGLSASTNGFAMMIGGGVDVKVTPRVAIRIFQVDWISWHTQGLTEKKNARISTGIVFRF